LERSTSKERFQGEKESQSASGSQKAELDTHKNGGSGYIRKEKEGLSEFKYGERLWVQKDQPSEKEESKTVATMLRPKQHLPPLHQKGRTAREIGGKKGRIGIQMKWAKQFNKSSQKRGVQRS